MKKKLKIMGAIVCILSVLSSGICAFAAGYTVINETDISYSAETRVEDDGMYGEEITTYSSLISNYSRGYAVVFEKCKTTDNGFVYYTESETQKVINSSGKVVEIGDFDTIGLNSGRMLSGRNTCYSPAAFGNGVDRFGGVKVSKNGKNGYVGLVDNVVIPCEYEYEIVRYEENLFGIGFSNPGQYGASYYFIDKTGKKLDISTEGPVRYVGNNVFGIDYYEEDGFRTEYVDLRGNKLENYTPDSEILGLEESLESSKYGQINGVSGLFVARSNGKYGIVDKKENIIVPFAYDDICGAQDGYCWAAKGGKWLLLRISTDEVKILVDDEAVAFDQIPLIINGRTLAPLRAIFEKLGATVEWDGETQTITSTKGDTVVIMTIDKNEMYKNGETILLDVAPQIVGERTLVPVRAIAEAFDCNVTWDDANYTVLIAK